MELSVIQKPDLVVAIDIGSTYSGYAWQWRSHFESNKQNVEFNTNWGSGTPQIHKTNTTILLKDDSNAQYRLKIIAFGYKAEQRFAKICSKDTAERVTYHLFREFKIVLYRQTETEGGPDPIAEDSNGMCFPFSNVMALFIKAMINDLFIKASLTKEVKNVLWVVTVPAIWSEKAKKIMQNAAVQAGIERTHLLLASEPEAAAIYCLNLPAEQQAALNNIRTPGHCFLAVDLGGGTADLSCVQVEEDGRLKEVCGEMGDLVGGQSVNHAFFQACNDNFKGTEWSRKFTEATPLELMTMEHEFEKSKIAIGSEEDDEFIQLPLPCSIRKSFRDGKIKLVKEQTQISITEQEDLKFDTSFVKDQLFDQSCKKVNKVIENVLHKQNNIQTVVLVGGFSESPIVQGKLKDMLQQKYPNVKVVVPTSPFRAVLMGAVLFGHDWKIYKSRISRATYGVSTNVLFDKMHDTTKKWLNKEDGKYYCKDVFDLHVTKGKSVVLNEPTIGVTYVPMFKHQKRLTLTLFKSVSDGHEDGAVMYTTDESCKKVGEISVDLPETDTTKPKREVCVRMIYGGTQLSVTATETVTGKEYNADISFNV